jgi:topoisomerase IV subunit B
VTGSSSGDCFFWGGRLPDASGPAKEARDRASQAVLPLHGKTLNVASAGKDKLAQNQQLRIQRGVTVMQKVLNLPWCRQSS